ncbi:tetratricopeptide repeat protein [Spirochaetia bacterium 38H-sp]|uniref:Tetratricopeptide repeat protein n=1 Tax=Rarispira pelagica TaxID=3141764 RepID=A0ABU9UB76_9SPIR
MVDNPFENGKELYRQGKYPEAIKEFLKSDTLEAKPSEIAYYMSLCYAKMKEYEEALLYLEQVLTTDSHPLKRYQARMLMGYIYAITERFKLAELEFSKVIEEGFSSASVYAALAHVLYMQGDTVNSLEALDKALSMDSDNPSALNSMGYILAEEGIKLPLAIKYCRRALDKVPSNPAYHDSYAWALYKNGQKRDAQAAIRVARKLLPDHPLVNEHYRVIMEL